MRRRNRNDRQIDRSEKLVAFRMSAGNYAVLKEIATKRQKPVALLINEILDQKLKLGERALRKEMKSK